MTDTPTVSPLREYAADSVPLSVATELEMAREALAETDPENIHDHDAMIRSAVSLSIRLRTLAAAVERGDSQ